MSEQHATLRLIPTFPRPNSTSTDLSQSILVLARLWCMRTVTRRQLDKLELHYLADIGLDETARRRECAKWFWQA